MNKNIFNSIAVRPPHGNTFDLTHDVKMSGMMGRLMPVNVQECVPGDRWKIGTDVFLRFMPMVNPSMQRYNVYTHTFFCPFRLVFPNWEDFITDKANGGLPFITIDSSIVDSQQKKFLDYMGIPPFPAVGGTPTNINAMPFAAYQRIYNEYYRDQNNIPSVIEGALSLADGNNNGVRDELLLMHNRAWEHDYFTSALPTAQQASAVDIPLGDVVLKSSWAGSTPANSPKFEGTTVIPNGAIDQFIGLTGPEIRVGGVGGTTPVAYNPEGTLESEATTINELRTAEKLQMVLEKFIRGGTRYTEMLMNFFNEYPQDSRLQRPEYITGSKTPVTISEVLNQTGINGERPQGDMAGHGVAIGVSYPGYYHVREHGYIITIMSILPKPCYAQGINRMYLRNLWTDFYFPEFAHLGEQGILNAELYAYTADGLDPDTPFGYTSRYAELKYQPPRIAGEMRDTLATWHSARIFTSPPTLSSAFIEMNGQSDEATRIFAVTDADEDYFVINVINKLIVYRLMPVYGTPML